MRSIRTLTKTVALLVMALWCVSVSWAGQAQTATQAPKDVKKAAAAKPAPPQGAKKSAVGKKPARRHKAVKKAAGATKPVPAPKASAPAGTTPTASPAPVKESAPAHLRDPFAALVRTGDAGNHMNLPPGIAGLQVATLRLQGLVQGPNGMIAIVANPEDRVYFLHEGDHIFDGLVEKIDLDKITFQQVNKDAFGRPVQREVVKRLYPIAGEEQ